VLNQWTADPATDSAADKAAAEFEYARSVEWFMDPSSKAATRHWRSRPRRQRPGGASGRPQGHHQKIDFLGVNYYFRAFCSTETPPRQPECKLGKTDMGWEIFRTA
jgi:beta-glucosidase